MTIALSKQLSLEEFLGLVTSATNCLARKSSNGYQVKCPAHDDNVASLSVKSGDNGKLLLHCFTGCSVHSICVKLGINISQIMGTKPVTTVIPQQRKVATHEFVYTDENRKVLYKVVRTDYIPKSKSIAQFRWDDATGSWQPGLKDVLPTIYNLPAVKAAASNKGTVYIVEGELKAEALIERGFVATTASGGANNWKPDHARHFIGLETVIILPDNDIAGEKYAAAIVASLTPIIPDLVVVPADVLCKDTGIELATKEDIVDFFTRGGTTDHLHAGIARARAGKLEKTLKGCETVDFTHITDKSLAEAVLAIQKQSQNLVYCEHKGWFIYYPDKGIWALDREGNIAGRQVVSDVETYLKSALIDDKTKDRIAKTIGNVSRQRTVLAYLSSFPSMRIDAADLDRPGLLGLQNGVIDLSSLTRDSLTTGKALLAHSPKFYLTTQAPVSFDANANCLKFRQFLRELFDEDNEKISFLRQMLGYSLLGKPVEKLTLWIIGPSGTGKSTLLSVLSGIFGPYVCSQVPTSFLQPSGNNDLEQYRSAATVFGHGYRMAFISEIAPNGIDQSMFKTITGGTDEVSIREMGVLSRSVPNRVVFFAAGNYLPRVMPPDTDMAFWSRLVILPTTNKRADKINTKLDQALSSERSGILLWILFGIVEYLSSTAEGAAISIPLSIKEIRQNQAQPDEFAEFANTQLVFGKQYTVAIRDINQAWENYAGGKVTEKASKRLKAIGTQWFDQNGNLAEIKDIQKHSGRYLGGVGLLNK